MQSTNPDPAQHTATTLAMGWLKAQVGAGRRCSRDLKADALAAGISRKALRKGRERLGLTVTRIGRRQQVRSFWALPQDPPPARKVPPAAPAAPPAAASLTERERDLVAFRTAAFGKAGMAGADASALALRLVLERDRTAAPAGTGSCVECSCYFARDCPATPKPPAELHRCLMMRKVTP